MFNSTTSGGISFGAAMFQFEFPWLLLLVAVPFLIYWFYPATSQRKRAALIAPFYQDIKQAAAINNNSNSITQITRVLFFISWFALVVSAANPVWVGEPVPLPTEGRNIMLAVDLSGSMGEDDFNYQGRWIDRLTATKIVAGSFIEKRKGDRLGLILFGDEAYLQSPLSFDRQTVAQLLNEAVLGLAGKNTAVGNAIGLAAKKISETKSDQRILILLTDGANTAGSIDPIKAAQLAATEGLKIYTIGIGAATRQTPFGLISSGGDLDEKTLKKVAELTGGQYFKANDLQELNRIYQLLDELEPVQQDEQFFRPKRSLYYWPLLLAVVILTLSSLLMLKGEQ